MTPQPPPLWPSHIEWHNLEMGGGNKISCVPLEFPLRPSQSTQEGCGGLVKGSGWDMWSCASPWMQTKKAWKELLFTWQSWNFWMLVFNCFAFSLFLIFLKKWFYCMVLYSCKWMWCISRMQRYIIYFFTNRFLKCQLLNEHLQPTFSWWSK